MPCASLQQQRPTSIRTGLGSGMRRNRLSRNLRRTEPSNRHATRTRWCRNWMSGSTLTSTGWMTSSECISGRRPCRRAGRAMRAMRAARQRRHYRQFQPIGPKRRRLWTPEGDARITAKVRPTDRKLSKTLGRSVQAIQRRRGRLARAKSDHRNRPKSSQIERTASRVRGVDR